MVISKHKWCNGKPQTENSNATDVWSIKPLDRKLTKTAMNFELSPENKSENSFWSTPHMQTDMILPPSTKSCKTLSRSSGLLQTQSVATNSRENCVHSLCEIRAVQNAIKHMLFIGAAFLYQPWPKNRSQQHHSSAPKGTTCNRSCKATIRILPQKT